MSAVIFTFLLAVQMLSGAAAYPECFICKSGIVTNQDVFVSNPGDFGDRARASCKTLDNAGRDGMITEEACSKAQDSKKFQKECGCEEVDPAVDEAVDEAVADPASTTSPLSVIVDPPVAAPVVFVSTPSDYPSAFPTASPTEAATTVQSIAASDVPGNVASDVPSDMASDVPSVSPGDSSGNDFSNASGEMTSAATRTKFAMAAIVLTAIYY